MNYKNIALLLLLLVVVLAVLLYWLNQPANDQYEIFSNIPTDNAKALVYMKFTDDGSKEFQELFGKLLTGNALKESQGSESAIAVYNDSMGVVSYSKTNMSVDDAINRMNSSMDERVRGEFTFEKKSIAGKDVTVVTVNTGSYKIPICIWKEGDTMKALIMFGFPKNTPYSQTTALAGDIESPLLGYALQSVYSAQDNFGNTCEVVMQRKYDTSNVKAMFNETEYIKSSIPVSGKTFGEVKLYAGDNALINGSGYIVMFGDDNADNIVAAGRADVAPLPTLQQTGNYCFTTGSSTDKSTIVQSNGRQACMKETKVSLIGMMQLITLQRKVGAYYIGVITYVKGDANAAKENAKNIAFSLNLPGSDSSWTDKANVEVKVYSDYGGTQPLGGARVDLFKSASGYYGYSTYGRGNGELIQTKYTDDSGVAEFNDVPLNESLYIVVSNEGYENLTRAVYSFTSPTDVYMTKTEAPSVSTSPYTQPSYATNVTIDEASLSNIQIISSDGLPLVKVAVGSTGTGRDVKAAGNIAAMIGNRAYKKVSITATLSNPHCTPAQCTCIPSIQTANVPVKLDTSKSKLVILDSDVTSGQNGNMDNNLISVGSPSVNTITADTMKRTSLVLDSPGDYIAQAVGINRIIIAGYNWVDTFTAANKFMVDLTAAGAGGGALTYSNTPIITSDGSPQVTIVVGEKSTAEDCVNAANIAAMIGNRAYEHQQVSAAYSGGSCIPSLNYSAQIVPLDPVTSGLVLLDTYVDTSATIIAIGPPSANTISNHVATTTFTQNDLEKGKAVVKGVGTNRIIIAGGTEMDTERAADRFIQWFATKYT